MQPMELSVTSLLNPWGKPMKNASRSSKVIKNSNFKVLRCIFRKHPASLGSTSTEREHFAARLGGSMRLIGCLHKNQEFGAKD